MSNKYLDNKESAAIGISMPIASIVRAPVAWRQARFSSESAAGPGVRYCRDLALPFLLETLRNEPATADLLHPALAALSTYLASGSRHCTWKVFEACSFMKMVSLVRQRTSS